jgi:hypothetical protein
MILYKLLKKLIFIYTAKLPHFLYVDFETYKKYKLLFRILISLNSNYASCEIFRIRFKNLRNFVVIGLKWNGKSVKRRTSGYAKNAIKKEKINKCIYCEKDLTEENATSDHILPISKKGNNCQVNLVICCRKCNCDRGNMDFEKFLKLKNPKYARAKYLFI